MNRLDVLVLVALVPFGLRGFWRGFLREGFGLVGVVGGVLLAVAASSPVADALVARGMLPPLEARLAAPVVVFLVVYVAAQVVGLVADRLARAILLGGLNRAAGLVFGVAKGAALVGFALLIAEGAFPSEDVTRAIERSTLGRPLRRFALAIVEIGRDFGGQPVARRA